MNCTLDLFGAAKGPRPVKGAGATTPFEKYEPFPEKEPPTRFGASSSALPSDLRQLHVAGVRAPHRGDLRGDRGGLEIRLRGWTEVSSSLTLVLRCRGALRWRRGISGRLFRHEVHRLDRDRAAAGENGPVARRPGPYAEVAARAGRARATERGTRAGRHHSRGS